MKITVLVALVACLVCAATASDGTNNKNNDTQMTLEAKVESLTAEVYRLVIKLDRYEAIARFAIRYGSGVALGATGTLMHSLMQFVDSAVERTRMSSLYCPPDDLSCDICCTFAHLGVCGDREPVCSSK